jgi:hypothetical protein
MGPQQQESMIFEKMRDWMDAFTTSDPKRLGMLIFEKTENSLPLIYASPAIRRYLGHGQDIMPPTLELNNIPPEEFEQFLNTRQYTFTHPGEDKPHYYRLTCKRYSSNGRKLYFAWVYPKSDTPPEEITKDTAPQASVKKKIFARTFGHFDLFVDGKPITFSSAKEKELMALLIDRNGGTLSTSEAVSYLWEDEAADDRVSTRYRKLAMGLKKTLESYGIGYILITQKGVRSVDVTALECDYYGLLAGDEKYRKSFHNAYMSDYSWSEETLAGLWLEPDDGE